MASASSLLGLDRKADDERDKKRHDGVFALIAVNLVFYVLDHILGLGFMKRLYLPLDGASFYQYVTAAFCHGGWQHLSGNLFFLYLFGKIVEEEEGTFGLIVTYLVTGIGGNVLSEMFESGGYGLGASGAVFGLFVVAVLIKLKWSVRSIVEAVILGQFVVVQLVAEAKSIGNSDGIGHLAHVGGALSGAALVYAVQKIFRKKGAEGDKAPGGAAAGVKPKGEEPKAKAK